MRFTAGRDSPLTQRIGGADRTTPLIDQRGTVVVHTDTVLVAARNGKYKVQMLVLMARAVALYGHADVALLVVAWSQRGGRNELGRRERCWRHWPFSRSDVQVYPTLTPLW